MPLGTEVQFKRSDILHRRSSLEGRHTKEAYIVPAEWAKSGYLTGETLGVIVGVRTLSNGEVYWEFEGIPRYVRKETVRAYLVAYDMNRDIVRLKVEDVHPLPTIRGAES